MGSHTDSLPTPATPAGRDGLDAILTAPGRAVLAFDFDGTLAPIVPDPDQARAHPDAVPALAAIAPRVAAVAVVTGRPADVAVRYGGFAEVPGLEHLVVLGHYGAERWDARTGTVEAPAPTPASPPPVPNSPRSSRRSDPVRGRGSRRRGVPSPCTPVAPGIRRPRSRPSAIPWPVSPPATD